MALQHNWFMALPPRHFHLEYHVRRSHKIVSSVELSGTKLGTMPTLGLGRIIEGQNSDFSGMYLGLGLAGIGLDSRLRQHFNIMPAYIKIYGKSLLHTNLQ
jgi:hypothetical protein